MIAPLDRLPRLTPDADRSARTRERCRARFEHGPRRGLPPPTAVPGMRNSGRLGIVIGLCLLSAAYLGELIAVAARSGALGR